MADLREQCVRSIKNYMADELKESSESGLMFEFYHKQGESIMTMVDGAIKAAKDSPMYKNSLP